MKYFAITYTYGEDAALVDATRPEHREFVANQLSLGRVVGSGPFVDGGQALIIIQLPDTATEADVTEIMDQDPYTVKGALAKREIREWKPVSNIFS
ncbi:YciI family protein [Corynebacterium sp. TA-R-1]|uniref:YciI family protein n=1 Tax=Corynebacterium stercoris TaxID=2943490 RepID=A0ABT1G3S1_9CORY|nr:YciI family protein [Corynebacterium stercoris]MCP1388635.1 YciI family protein [Corynebacterium stercoris]